MKKSRKFLLTRLSRGVTIYFLSVKRPNIFLLTRLSRGVTYYVEKVDPGTDFYSHASREA